MTVFQETCACTRYSLNNKITLYDTYIKDYDGADGIPGKDVSKLISFLFRSGYSGVYAVGKNDVYKIVLHLATSNLLSTGDVTKILNGIIRHSLYDNEDKSERFKWYEKLINTHNYKITKAQKELLVKAKYDKLLDISLNCESIKQEDFEIFFKTNAFTNRFIVGNEDINAILEKHKLKITEICIKNYTMLSNSPKLSCNAVKFINWISKISYTLTDEDIVNIYQLCNIWYYDSQINSLINALAENKIFLTLNVFTKLSTAINSWIFNKLIMKLTDDNVLNELQTLNLYTMCGSRTILYIENLTKAGIKLTVSNELFELACKHNYHDLFNYCVNTDTQFNLTDKAFTFACLNTNIKIIKYFLSAKFMPTIEHIYALCMSSYCGTEILNMLYNSGYMSNEMCEIVLLRGIILDIKDKEMIAKKDVIRNFIGSYDTSGKTKNTTVTPIKQLEKLCCGNSWDAIDEFIKTNNCQPNDVCIKNALLNPHNEIKYNMFCVRKYKPNLLTLMLINTHDKIVYFKMFYPELIDLNVAQTPTINIEISSETVHFSDNETSSESSSESSDESPKKPIKKSISKEKAKVSQNEPIKKTVKKQSTKKTDDEPLKKPTKKPAKKIDK